MAKEISDERFLGRVKIRFYVRRNVVRRNLICDECIVAEVVRDEPKSDAARPYAAHTFPISDASLTRKVKTACAVAKVGPISSRSSMKYLVARSSRATKYPMELRLEIGLTSATAHEFFTLRVRDASAIHKCGWVSLNSYSGGYTDHLN